MFGDVLCLLMLTILQNLRKTVSFMYLIHVFEFMCFKSYHQKLFYEIDNVCMEIDVMQKLFKFSFSKTVVRLQLCWR